MRERLTSRMLASALVRRAGQDGGFATIMRKGDEVAGTILLLCMEKGEALGLFERMPDYEGGYRLVRCGPNVEAFSAESPPYLERRVKTDPDIWIIELDIPQPERFAAEIIC
ncbi:DUF1491 family protein [Rhizorhapis suberifaciens]|uniref:DUF1491 family protein n=1 Tax=Rhizorhapis suberifaciens TaxID=13656 RepID=A0A840HT97_9SPHN|nr:DUF1491 family protein [Rhizorhapis suberifaciens]MBB4640778.1 hypothetical protein [Rhizorhapis suberifaciens]